MQQLQEDMITVHIECLTAISVVLTSNDKGHETTNIAQEEQQNAGRKWTMTTSGNKQHNTGEPPDR
jgi:hypothetical protein